MTEDIIDNDDFPQRIECDCQFGCTTKECKCCICCDCSDCKQEECANK